MKTIEQQVISEMRTAMLKVRETWDRQRGRVFESMGSDNPRAMAIDESIDEMHEAIRNAERLLPH